MRKIENRVLDFCHSEFGDIEKDMWNIFPEVLSDVSEHAQNLSRLHVPNNQNKYLEYIIYSNGTNPKNYIIRSKCKDNSRDILLEYSSETGFFELVERSKNGEYSSQILDFRVPERI